ncbi:MAG: chromosomal replication initiator DnaA [Alphaproteobacteria bacterium HGW-Alphaproteobacteria-2]|nr:MAG: chromosomal replication initiator DnaA [Alphaproteobacteria bacterium HGW-Alphaproteobacteria-2]
MTEPGLRQLTFDLPVRPALGREDYFVSPANALAVAALERWRDWPSGRMVLSGPESAGKTHLAHVWAAETGAVIATAAELTEADLPALAERAAVVEDIDRIAGRQATETALFHLLNMAAEAGGPLLLTGSGRPAHWPFALADLASRVQAMPVASLDAMDDALLSALLAKLFADRQLAVSPGVISWMVRRIERSFAGAQRAVVALDARALAEGRAITRQLAAEVLARAGDWST